MPPRTRVPIAVSRAGGAGIFDNSMPAMPQHGGAHCGVACGGVATFFFGGQQLLRTRVPIVVSRARVYFVFIYRRPAMPPHEGAHSGVACGGAAICAT